MTDLLDRLRVVLADRYSIERELGRGGMAVVYLARDLQHDRLVALKLLRPELAESLGAERFLREIQIAAQLNHPHILPLHESGETDGLLWYTMPFIEGESLRGRLDREDQLAVDDALQIAKEVADGLGYAHSLGVVHRDIKPENILLSGGHAVIADFGIARAVTEAGSERLTETGLAIGTPAYMSPEQGAGSGKVDARSDLYSLGCVLYEMLAGEPPYTGPTAPAIVAKKMSEPTPRISVVREVVPGPIEKALSKALNKTPADRFATAEQFAEALDTDTVGWAEEPVPPKRRFARVGALVGITAVAVVTAGILLGRRSGDTGFRLTEIAVLPFENLSATGSHSFPASGIHSELITQLGTVSQLKPRGRTSVMGYAGTAKPLAQVAQELGVGSIVEATVQVVGNRLHLNAALIDAATGEQLWQDQYDEVLDDLLAVQNDIAWQIVMGVGAAITDVESTNLAAVPTENAEAYRLYLQGEEYFTRPGKMRRNYEIAQSLFEQAVALDSTFALAHAALSEVHGWMSWHRYDPSPARLMRQHTAAETALRHGPDLPQAHLAMGLMHYHGTRDWRAALEEFRVALEGLPNDAELWLRIGYAYRRLGDWQEVLTAFDKVVTLDPRNVDALSDLGGHTFSALQRYGEAVDWYSRTLALAPDVAGKDVFRAWVWVKWHGWLDSLAAALDRHPADANVGSSGSVRAWRALTLFWERQPDSLLALLSQTPQSVFDGKEFYLPTALYSGWAQQLKGDVSAAQVAFDSAQTVLDSVIRDLPDDWRVRVARGLALAGSGHRQEALREARWLQQPGFYEDPMDGSVAVEGRALILVQVGETDTAIDEIERMLAKPAFLFSVNTLRLNPLFDPIRNDQRFQALIERYENQ